jgi:hypothetical protein
LIVYVNVYKYRFKENDHYIFTIIHEIDSAK